MYGEQWACSPEELRLMKDELPVVVSVVKATTDVVTEEPLRAALAAEAAKEGTKDERHTTALVEHLWRYEGRKLIELRGANNTTLDKGRVEQVKEDGTAGRCKYYSSSVGAWSHNSVRVEPKRGIR
eukprot:SAG31_NODE_603_length_13622_cov_19.019953_6_plen_126_part_00